MLIGMCLFANYPKETRLDYIVRFYDAISLFKISCPHPSWSVYARHRGSSALGTDRVRRQPDSINTTINAIVKYVSLRRHRHQRGPYPCQVARSVWRSPAHWLHSILQTVSGKGQVLLVGWRTRWCRHPFYPLWYLEVEPLLVLKTTVVSKKTVSATWTAVCRSTS